MTVCIAAICERGKAIVLAADRFRWHATASIEAELDEPKFHFMGESLAVMGSGSSATFEDVMRRFRSMPPQAGMTAVDAAAHFQDACQASRTKQMETLYSKRFLGLKFDEFKSVVVATNPGSIALDLYNKALNYDFGTIFIVAGIDSDGPHIHQVDDGADVSQTETGYTAIGTGGVLASVALARRSYRKSCALAEALYYVYEAKKTAELARGVGTTTDISVIRKGKKPLVVGKREFAALESTYDRLAPPTMSKRDVNAIVKALAHK
jgi:20S proteasome alpha/beta subunit